MPLLTTLALAAGGGAALAGLAKGLGQDPYDKLGSPSDMVMVNQAQVSDFLQRLAGQQSVAQGRYDQWSGRSSSALDALQALTGNYSNLQKQLQGLIPEYAQLNQQTNGVMGQLAQIANEQDPSKAMNLFLGKVPELQEVISSLTANAAGGTSDALRRQAALLGKNAGADVGAQLAQSGLLSSGAGVAALAKGIAEPSINAEVALQQNYGQLYNSLAQQLLGGALSSYNQGVQGADQAAIQALSQMLQGYSLQGQNVQGAISGLLGLGSLLGQQGAGYEAVASGYGSLAGQQQSLLNSILGIQAEYNQPVWWQPSYVANPDYLGAGTLLNMGTSLLGAGMMNSGQSKLAAALAQPAAQQSMNNKDLMQMLLSGGWGGNAGGSVQGNSRFYGS